MLHMHKRNKTMLTFALIIIIFLFMLVIQPTSYASDNTETKASIILVTADSYWSYLEAEEDSPYVISGVTMVPLRALTEALGYDVTFLDKERKVTIKNDTDKIELYLDSNTVFVNGKEDFMLQKPTIRNSRTFVPLRYIAEFFGFNLYWQLNTSYSYDYMEVWVSALALLEKEDVVPNDNYLEIVEDFCYKLKDTSATYRGAKVGDTYERIIDLYGKPHGKENNGEHDILYYTTISHPDKNDGTNLAFFLLDNIVKKIEITYGT